MKIYLSGPITGDPDYAEKFAHAERVTILAFPKATAVMNPVKMFPPELTPRDYMVLSLAALQCADLVVMLDGWRDSPGASIEEAVAKYFGIARIPQFVVEKFSKEATT